MQCFIEPVAIGGEWIGGGVDIDEESASDRGIDGKGVAGEAEG